MGTESPTVVIAGAMVVIATALFSGLNSLGLNVDGDQEHDRTIARDAAFTALHLTARRLVEDSVRWTNESPRYAFSGRSYMQARFSTALGDEVRRGPMIGGCGVDTIAVQAEGITPSNVRHFISAVYVRTCRPTNTPPWQNYAAAAGEDLVVDGNWIVMKAHQASSAALHANRAVRVRKELWSDGPTSFRRGSGDSATDPLRLDDMRDIDAKSIAHLTDRRDVRLESGQIDFTHFRGIHGFGTDVQPFVWFIDGDLEIAEGASISTSGYGVIFVDGSVTVGRRASILPKRLSDYPPVGFREVHGESVRGFVKQHLAQGSQLAFYVRKGVESEGIHIKPNAVVAANLYTSDDVILEGASIIGAVVSGRTIREIGNTVIWHVPSNPGVIIPWFLDPLPDGVRMLAFEES